MSNLLPILFIPAFILFWCFVVKLISIMSGWNRLAQCFRTEVEPAGRSFKWRSMRMGLSNYNGCLNAVVCEEGLYLSLMFIFKVGHPPLLIPWMEIYDPVEEKFFFWRFTKISVGRPVLAKIQLTSDILDAAGELLQKRK
jgi:hypothetical protein